MTAGLPLMKSVLTPLAKIVLLPLGLSAGMSAIQRKIYRLGSTALIILNEEMNDIMKIGKSLEEPGLLIKGVCETIKHETKEQKGAFLLMLLGTLAASMLRSELTGRAVIIAGKGTIRSGEGTIRAGENF